MKSMLKQVVTLSLLLSVPAVFAADVVVPSETATGSVVKPSMYRRGLVAATNGAVAVKNASVRGAVAAKNLAVRGAVATKNAAVVAGSAVKVKAAAAGTYALNTKAGKFIINGQDSNKVRAAKIAGAVVVTTGTAVATRAAYRRFAPTVVQNSSFNPVNWPSMAYNKAFGKKVVAKKTVETQKDALTSLSAEERNADAQAWKQAEARKLAQNDAAFARALQDEEYARAIQAKEDAMIASSMAVAPKAPVAAARPVNPVMNQHARRNAARKNGERKVVKFAQSNRRRPAQPKRRPAQQNRRVAKVTRGGCANGMCSRARA